MLSSPTSIYSASPAAAATTPGIHLLMLGGGLVLITPMSFGLGAISATLLNIPFFIPPTVRAFLCYTVQERERDIYPSRGPYHESFIISYTVVEGAFNPIFHAYPRASSSGDDSR